MKKVTIQLGEQLFAFSSRREWINRGQRIWRVHRADSRNSICIDTKGRICTVGAHFMRAEADGSYPITVYRKQVDDRLNGSELDLSETALLGPEYGDV